VFRGGFVLEGRELRDNELSLVTVEGDVGKIEIGRELGELFVVCVE